MDSLNSSIRNLNRVGDSTAKRLMALGIETIHDLIMWLPFRYEDYSQVTKIKDLQIGSSANVVGTVELIQNNRSPRKRLHITEALVSDESDKIKVIWFNQPFITKNLKEGDRVSLAGRIDRDYSGPLMNSPAYERLGQGQAVHTQGLIPIYHLTAGITQKQLRFFIKETIALADHIIDWLPGEIKQRRSLLDISEALRKIHFPKSRKELDEAKRRLAFNELFLLQAQAHIARQKKAHSKAIVFPFREEDIRSFVASLPFQLTDGQKQAAWQIIQDIALDKPMARLLEGDVGSGKTVVAAMAMLNVALEKNLNAQCALLAPTEILASQHFASLTKLYSKQDLKLALFTRSEQRLCDCNSGKDEKLSKKKMAGELAAGHIDIVIGTHAILQEDIKFLRLGLAIIDEQHRFGVEQRQALTQCSIDQSHLPHLLSMTATPIPRSLAQAIFGDLDISVISELPKNRLAIETRLINENNRQAAYDFIRQEINAGRQAFVICPLIDLSDKLGVKSVKEEFKRLDEEIFPSLKLGMLHGRLSSKEKEAAMQDFVSGNTQILVSTSVVEVGVDIPNASVMMIEGAERFGLAQLHQFRGRVGRGAHKSYCFLFSESDSPETRARLGALVASNDGFALAKMDLKQRGPGEVFGTAQKGFPDLKVANLFDHILIKEAQEEARLMLEAGPDLREYPLLNAKLGHLETETFFC